MPFGKPVVDGREEVTGLGALALIAPEAGQVVKFAGFAVEDVDDEIAVVEQDPFGGIVAFDADGTRLELLF